MNEMKIYTDLVYGKYTASEIPNNIDHRYCFLALQSVVRREFIQTREFLDLALKSGEKENECYMQLEAKSLLYYFSGEFDVAEEFALQAIALEERSFYSRSLLARLAGWKKDFISQAAILEKALQFYSGHSGTLLDLAQSILSGKGKYQNALGFVHDAEPSFRRFLYLLLIPLSNPVVRLSIVVICLLLFFVTTYDVTVLIAISLLIIIGFVVSLVKLRWDSLVGSRIFLLQFTVLISWALFRLIFTN